jgi:hypothetical protein
MAQVLLEVRGGPMTGKKLHRPNDEEQKEEEESNRLRANDQADRAAALRRRN